ncbi:MAG: DUF3305 domain-containing protein [Halofilum sp. (in: g-proteobacteria)]|nr:DUF3305 domain-containing protein [Halofilum sp. (in: g-proteobacteria)]
MSRERTGRGRPLETWNVRVLMRRGETRQGRWSVPRWEVLAVLPDTEPPDTFTRRLVHEDEAHHDFEWRGLVVALFRDAAESYWYNLVGREPSLFVICRPGEDIDLEPFAVSANYDEAGAYMETDESVFRAPLPTEFGPRLEEFVMTHYRPEAPRKRRRRNWAAEAADGGSRPAKPRQDDT